MSIANKLKELNIILPTPATPVANYVPFVIHNNLVYISGQLPMDKGKVAYTGIVGKDLTQEDAVKAAEFCAINILAQLNAACEGNLEKVTRCIKLGVFVASTPEFTSQPAIGNGASNLIANIFGDKGKHARLAVGVSSLPLNAAVEIEAIFAI
jgi:enamine deaminase RidA (YjgF/YER057c/UK114 family)